MSDESFQDFRCTAKNTDGILRCFLANIHVHAVRMLFNYPPYPRTLPEVATRDMYEFDIQLATAPPPTSLVAGLQRGRIPGPGKKASVDE